MSRTIVYSALCCALWAGCAHRPSSPPLLSPAYVDASSKELYAFIAGWLAGLDGHAPASFFLERLAPDFELRVSKGPAIRDEGALRRWLATFHGVTSQRRRLRRTYLQSLTPTSAVVRLRIDAHGSQGDRAIFRPTSEVWYLRRIAGAWRVLIITANRLVSTRHRRLRQWLAAYLQGHPLRDKGRGEALQLGEGLEAFLRFGGPAEHRGPAAYRSAMSEARKRFALRTPLSHEIVSLGFLRAVLRLRSPVEARGRPYAAGEHCWTEALRFDTKGRIAAMEVLPNLGRSCAEATDRHGMSAIHRAAGLGILADLRTFAARGDDLALINEKGASPLYYAAQNPRAGLAVFRFYAKTLGREAFAALTRRAVIPNQHTLALEAVFNVNEPVLRFLLAQAKAGAAVDLHTPTVFGWTPRSFAAREKLAIAGLLPRGAMADRLAFLRQREAIWLQAEGNERHRRGLALIAAATRGDRAAVDRLLAAGVDINGRYGRLGALALNSLSRPGLSRDEERRRVPMLLHLLNKGADPLHREGGIMQVGHGFRESVFGHRKLLSAALGTLSRDRRLRYLNQRGPLNGYTKLIDAALRGRTAIMELLVNEGADLSIRGYNGLGAYDAALLFNRNSQTRKIPGRVLDRLRPSIVIRNLAYRAAR